MTIEERLDRLDAKLEGMPPIEIVVRGHGGLGHMRRRAKPWGLGFLGFLSPGVLSLGGPWPAFGLMAGIRGDPRLPAG